LTFELWGNGEVVWKGDGFQWDFHFPSVFFLV
jgi:hypothetical protein